MYEDLIELLRRETTCDYCKYDDECTGDKDYCQLNRDAAEAIEQLSAELEREKEMHQHTSEVAFAFEDEVKRLKQELDIKTRMEQAMTDIAQDFQKQLHDAQDRLEQVEQERDAAVADLKRYGQCGACKHYPECGANEHSYCDGGFEWRGVAKETAE